MLLAATRNHRHIHICCRSVVTDSPRPFVCVWYRATVFRDDAAAAFVDHGSCLIPCPTQAYLLIDKYDVRHVMDATSRRRLSQARHRNANRAGHACPSPCHAGYRPKPMPCWISAQAHAMLDIGTRLASSPRRAGWQRHQPRTQHGRCEWKW